MISRFSKPGQMRIPLLACMIVLIASTIAYGQPSFGRGGDRGSDRGGDRGGSPFGRGGFGGDRGSFGRGGDRGGSPFGRGGDRGGSRFGRGGDRGGSRGGFDPTAMLQRFDRNRDGKIDPNELDERTRAFAGRMIERMGFDPKKPVSIKEMAKKIEERRGGQPQEEQSKEDLAKTFGIPGFEDVMEELPPLVPDFYLQPDSPLLLAGSLESRYDKSILDQVNRSLRSYDRNKDGKLDNQELRRGRFSNPPLEESDLDKDGNLSKVELAERYVARAGGRGRIGDKSKQTSTSRFTSSRGDERSNRWDRFRREGPSGDDRKDSAEKKSVRKSSSSSNSSSKSRSSTRRSSNSGDKITSYAKSIMKKYDKDEDGAINAEEAKSASSLPKGADKDKDGMISLDELIVAYGGSASGGSSSGGRSSRNRNASNNPYIVRNGADRNSEADRDFRELDKDRDGLLAMQEFASQWSNEVAEQFLKLDKDNNGVLTIGEWSKGGGLRSSRTSSYSRSSSSRSSRRN